MGSTIDQQETISANIEVNKSIIFRLLFMSGIGIIFTGLLVFLFSGSLLTVFCSLVFGVTALILVIYFFIRIKVALLFSVRIEPTEQENLDIHSVMKIE